MRTSTGVSHIRTNCTPCHLWCSLQARPRARVSLNNNKVVQNTNTNAPAGGAQPPEVVHPLREHQCLHQGGQPPDVALRAGPARGAPPLLNHVCDQDSWFCIGKTQSNRQFWGGRGRAAPAHHSSATLAGVAPTTSAAITRPENRCTADLPQRLPPQYHLAAASSVVGPATCGRHAPVSLRIVNATATRTPGAPSPAAPETPHLHTDEGQEQRARHSVGVCQHLGVAELERRVCGNRRGGLRFSAQQLRPWLAGLPAAREQSQTKPPKPKCAAQPIKCGALSG
jgi:hypothetical protein